MDEPFDLPVIDGYDAWAPLYDDDGNPLTAIEGPAIRALFGPLEGRKALDLGCGTGRHTLPLVAGGATVAALDGSGEMLARARHKLRGYPVEWHRHRLSDPLPFPDSTFDLIVLGLVVEHIADLAALMGEAARVSKAGRPVPALEPAPGPDRERPAGPVHRPAQRRASPHRDHPPDRRRIPRHRRVGGLVARSRREP